LSLSRKAINFDLSTNELRKHFADTRKPYEEIKKFMLANGFEHRQYSGYASKKKEVDDEHILSLAESLHEKFAWLSSCILKFDATDIGEQYDLAFVFENKIISKNDETVKTNKKGLHEDSPQKEIKKNRHKK